MAYAILFGNIVTCSIAALSIILWWTKSKFYGIARSKWVDYRYTGIYIYVHLTKRLYIATWLSAAWLGSGSDFEQICLKIHFMELQVRMGWLLHTNKYTYIYIHIIYMKYGLAFVAMVTRSFASGQWITQFTAQFCRIACWKWVAPSLYICIYTYHTRLILSNKITHSMTGVQIRFWPTLYIRQFHRIARSHLVSNICQCIFVFLQGLDIGTYLLRIQFETSWCTKWLSAIWISKACSNWCPVCIGVV